MKAMILAAGRGERLRPMTDRRPKPLIDVGGQPLIAHHLRALAAAGFREVVINAAYRGAQLREAIGDGRRYGLTIAWSMETPGALDTGGGIAQALPLLGAQPFAVISADVFTDFDYARLPVEPAAADVHLVLVPNPAHHPRGDFGCIDGRLTDSPPRATYAGIGVFRPALFGARRGERFALSEIIRNALAAQRASAQHHAGRWIDVGRPATLAAARQAASASG